MHVKKGGQIWIETAIYTLIGLALIGMVLGFAMPKIKQAQEKIIVEQSYNSLKSMDTIIRDVVNQGAGNRRQYELIFKKGKFTIDQQKNIISFTVPELSKAYSQPGINVSLGNIKLLTTAGKKDFTTVLRIEYGGYADIIVKNAANTKEYSPAPTPYKIFVFNNGTGKPSGLPGIIIEE